MSGIKQVIVEEKLELGLVSRDQCSKEENLAMHKLEAQDLPLPEGVYPYETIPGEYYRVDESDYSAEEMTLLLNLQRNKYLRNISRSITLIAFILVLTSLIVWLPGLIFSMNLR